MAGVDAGSVYLDVIPKIDGNTIQKEGVGLGKKLAAGIAAAGVGRLIASSIGEARESRKIADITAAAIKSTGNAAKVSAAQIAEHAEALALKTGVDDEAIQSGQNLLLTFGRVRNEVGKGNDVFTRATQLGLDMSVALGTDAKGAALQLGKALNDPVRGLSALSRAGVSFTAQQKDQIKTLVETGNTLEAQKIILGELETQFGGAAEAAADPMAKLQVVTGNLKEELGAALLPVVDRVSTALAEMSPEARTAAAKLTLVAGGAAGTAIAIGKIAPGVTATKDAMKAISGPVAEMIRKFKESRAAGEGLGTALASRLTPRVVGVGAALGLGAIALAWWTRKKEEAQEATRDYTAALEADSGAIGENTRATAAQRLEQAGALKAAQELGIGLDTLTDAALGQADAQAQVQAVIDDALDAGDAQRAGWDEQTLAANDLNQALRGEVKFLGDTQAALDRTEVATGAVATQQERAATAALDMSAAVDRVHKAMERAVGRTFDLTDATSDWKEALDNARKALKESGGSVDLNTQKGRDAHAQLKALVDIGNLRAETEFRVKKNVTQANEVAEEQRDRLREVAEKLGLAKNQADKYVKALGDIKPSYKTRVDLNTRAAHRAIRYLERRLENLGQAHTPGNITAQVGNNPVVPGGGGSSGLPATGGLPEPPPWRPKPPEVYVPPRPTPHRPGGGPQKRAGLLERDRAGGDTIINVYVNVEGNVRADRDLAVTVRKELESMARHGAHLRF